MKKLIILFSNFSFILSQVFEGLTLLTNLGGAPGIEYKTRLINNDFEEINVWSHGGTPYSIGYLSPDSVLTIGYKQNQDNDTAPRVVKLNWQGEIIWEGIFDTSIIDPHHDIEPMPNGNILLIGWESISPAQATQAGRLDVSSTFNPDKIIEIHPYGDSDYDIVWQWRAWEHTVQNVGQEFDNFGVVLEHPRLADINLTVIGPGQGDWMHTNAISYNEGLDQVALSVRHLCEIWIIDHSTTVDESSGHSGGNAGYGGDIIYRWGNPANYDRGDDSEQILDAPHGVNWIPDSYSGGGNILIFNNRHDTNNSAILEVAPEADSSGAYIIDDQSPFLPELYDWIYQDNFYSLNQSGAFRLPNGNTLLTTSSDSKVFEISGDEVVWEFSYTSGGFIPRAIKYPLHYLNSCLAGDSNQDGNIDLFDIVLIISFIIGNDSPTADEQCSSDINQDGSLDIEDILQIIHIIINT
jgi:hypothetical protein